MSKFYLALCAVLLSVLGGCATTAGDVIGTSVSNNPTTPPYERMRIDG